MNIYINGRFLTQSITGVQRYAYEVIQQLDNLIEIKKLAHTYNFEIVAPKNTIHEISLKNIRVRKVGILTGHLWEQLELPFYIRNGLLINFCNTAPIFNMKQIVTIHDASIYLKDNNFSKLFKAWYKILYFIEIKTAKRIITVSQFSCDELIRYTRVDRNKIRVIYEGNEHIKEKRENKDILSKYSLDNIPYVLAVSSMDPRKNFKSLVSALEKLRDTDINVVIAGGTNPRVFSNQHLQFPKKVKYLGYVSDEELKALYMNAYCFVYPSLYEGFGLPPLESMTLGCPVIVSNRASLPEVCGDSALYCNPDAPEDIANKIMQMFNNKKLRDEFRNKGLRKAKEFSWEKCAADVLETICNIK